MPKTQLKPETAKPKTARAEPRKTRRLQAPQRIWYEPLTWRHRPLPPTYKPLPKARLLFAAVLRQLWHDKLLFGGIVLVYGILNLLLVRGLSGSNNLATIKGTLDSVVHGFGGKVISSVAGFGYLLTTSGSGDAADSGVYQSLLFLVCSLAFIWGLRQTLAKQTVRIRDSFYQGMYPLIPFLLIFLLASLQLLPLLIVGGLYGIAVNGGIAVHAWEKAICLGLFLGTLLWSLRMLTASIFAMYIATLPDMTPLRAYRSARQLVYRRRLLVWRKLMFLVVALLVLAALVELPLILFLTVLAPWVFFVLAMLSLPIIHGYLYNLYREML